MKTSIDFKKSSMESANLVWVVSKYKHAHYKREEWGSSAAWIVESKRKRVKCLCGINGRLLPNR